MNSGSIRVLHVMEALEGGTARHLVDLVRMTPRVDQHVVVPSVRVGGVTDLVALDDITEAGATIHRVPMTRSPLTRTNAAAIGHIGRVATSVAPDVMHTHSSIGGVVGRIVARRRRRTPVLYTPNGVTDSRTGRLVERALRRATDGLIAVSESEAARVVELSLADPEQVRVIANGLDLERDITVVDLHELLGLDPSTPLVGTVSRLVPQKDPLCWVEMARLLSRSFADVHFVLVGDGALRVQVEAAVAAAGLAGRFHLIPQLDGAAGALGSLDVFVMSSVFEGAPYAPMEAMAQGVPVVMTAVTGNADLVVDGESGSLVPPGRPDELARAVGDLLSDRALAASIGARGRVRVEHKFSAALMGATLRELYEELASARLAASTINGPR